jgi:hypothetical protein
MEKSPTEKKVEENVCFSESILEIPGIFKTALLSFPSYFSPFE